MVALKLLDNVHGEDTMFDAPFYHVVFSHTVKAVYCPVPKAACTSLKEYMRRLEGLPPSSSSSLIHDRERNGLLYAYSVERQKLIRALFSNTHAYFKFTVVRNPFARLASAYFDLIEQKELAPPRGGETVTRLKNMLIRKRDVKPSHLPSLGFDDFVEAVEIDNPLEMDRHWQPQAIVSCRNLFRHDMAIKIEELSARAMDLADKLGGQQSIEQKLNTRSAGKSITDLYNARALDIVRRVYANDFRAFRYDMDDVPSRL